MTVLNWLERHFSRFAIPHLIRYVVILNVLVYLLAALNPEYISMLLLDRSSILQGQVWRLISWVFVPNTTSPLWIIFFLMFTWWLGDMLESTWGTFRLNLYYLLGVFFSTLSAFIFDFSFGNFLLTFSLLLAVATLAPDMEILFFFIPMKFKWVALISLVWPWGFLFVTGPIGVKLLILLCLGNYFMFFGPTVIRQMLNQRSTVARRAKFEAAKADDDFTLHRCATCGITEVTNPEADFRVAANGHEYCVRHLPES